MLQPFSRSKSGIVTNSEKECFENRLSNLFYRQTNLSFQ